MSAPRWKRSASVRPENAITFTDDWTLLGADGERLARIHNADREDGVQPGAWRWRIYRADGASLGGSASTGRDPKAIAERRAGVRG